MVLTPHDIPWSLRVVAWNIVENSLISKEIQVLEIYRLPRTSIVLPHHQEFFGNQLCDIDIPPVCLCHKNLIHSKRFCPDALDSLDFQDPEWRSQKISEKGQLKHPNKKVTRKNLVNDFNSIIFPSYSLRRGESLRKNTIYRQTHVLNHVCTHFFFEHGPGLKMYFLLNMGNLPAIAMLVYQRIINFFSGWWNFKYVLFSTLFGEDEPILTSIFFRWAGSTTN